MNTAECIAQIASLLGETSRERILVTVDGPCGSGKSTLAAALARELGAPIVHMDDYVIPHGQKTPERLAVPGGNADQERLIKEVIRPWMAGDAVVVRPYLCHADCFGEGSPLPETRVLILEGTYCNLPAIAEHAALRLFLTVSPEVQQSRLLMRVGPERLRDFNARWIPLENAYFSAFSLPDAGCVIMDM